MMSSTAAASRMSSSWSSASPAPERFSRRPVERSSTTVTSWPRSRRASTRLEPMKPAPPVTRVRIERGMVRLYYLPPMALPQLRSLEDEAVHVFREVAAEFERPVLLFSGGKDSLVLLRLAEKAFRPARFPFPLLHVDTGHNFPEVIAFRDRRVAE